MGTNTEELRREIAQTRDGLGETLDAIGDRVSPSRVVQRRKNRMTNAIRSASDRVMGVASDTRHAVGDGTSSMAHSVKDGVTGTADAAMQTVHEMPQAVRGQAQGSPMAAGAIAFGIGFLAAAAFPPTRTERQLAGNMSDKIEPLKHEASAAAHELVDGLKEPAREAVDAVKGTAAQGAHSVQDTAREAAQQAKDDVVQAKGDGQQAPRP